LCLSRISGPFQKPFPGEQVSLRSFQTLSLPGASLFWRRSCEANARREAPFFFFPIWPRGFRSSANSLRLAKGRATQHLLFAFFLLAGNPSFPVLWYDGLIFFRLYQECRPTTSPPAPCLRFGASSIIPSFFSFFYRFLSS